MHRSARCSLTARHAAPQAPGKLPALVQKELAKMNKTCREAGGKPASSHPGLVTTADLTGDGVQAKKLDFAPLSQVRPIR